MLPLIPLLKRKRKRKQLSEDPRLDSTLWELAEVLAEIAGEDGKPAGDAIKHRPNESTNAAGEATAE